VYGVGNGARVDRFAERAAAVWMAVDGDGDGVRQVLPTPLEVEVVAGPPEHLVATLPSVAAPGDTVELHVAVLDRAGSSRSRRSRSSASRRRSTSRRRPTGPWWSR
jgi:hypothetical protein